MILLGKLLLTAMVLVAALVDGYVRSHADFVIAVVVVAAFVALLVTAWLRGR